MKRLLSIFFTIIFLSSPIALADGDLWDNYGDQNVYGKQQAVSDEEFDKALESKMKKKRRNRKIPRGTEFHQSNETEIIKAIEEEPDVLCLPVNISINREILPVGHYQVEGEMKNGKPYLKLYQAHYLMAEVPAIETTDDYNQETVHFVKLLEHGNDKVKIIFGSLDFNAYSILDIAE